jgi:serine/threonine protein kinase
MTSSEEVSEIAGRVVIDSNRHHSAMLSRYVVDPSRFTTQNPIAKGSFSQVFTATDSTTGAIVALKVHLPVHHSDAEVRYFRELEVLVGNTHPATLRLIGFSVTGGAFRIVTPFPANGQLSKVLGQASAAAVLDATRKSKIIFGIIAGMAQLHARGVLHRDLKPENIFLDDQFEPVISDFCCSRQFDGGLELTASIGTPTHMAPELVSGDGDYNFAVDVYAFAVTLYRLFADAKTLSGASRPFTTPFELLTRVTAGVRFVKAPEIPEAIWDIITRCWEQDPAKRPTFWQLLNEFHGGQVYPLAGPDRAAILEYEGRVWSDFGPPKF